MTSCEPENQLGRRQYMPIVLSFKSPLFDFFFNTKVNNTSEGAPRSVYTAIYSDTLPQIIALSELWGEEWTAKINCSCRVHMHYLYKYQNTLHEFRITSNSIKRDVQNSLAAGPEAMSWKHKHQQRPSYGQFGLRKPTYLSCGNVANLASS